MRDRNHLNQQQFNIQLEKFVLSSKFYNESLKKDKYFSHKTSLWRSDPKYLVNSHFLVIIPKSFQETRALAIGLWYLPENLHFLVLLEMRERTFSHFNSKQRIELSVLLHSKEIMQKFLFHSDRFTGNELFGNIIGSSLKSSCFKILLVKQQEAEKKVFRRGPKDHGSRRSDLSLKVIEEEQRKDAFLAEQELQLKKKEYLTLKTISRLLQFIENLE